MDIIKIRYNYRKLIGQTEGFDERGYHWVDSLVKGRIKGLGEVTKVERVFDIGEYGPVYEEDVSEEYGEI
jgi:hypothetical protein